jgi:hypothetical protein
MAAMAEEPKIRRTARETQLAPQSIAPPAHPQLAAGQKAAPPSIPAKAGGLPARKPVSERKLAANRANALRSTGPRTPEGKARVRWNAVKHGLLSREIVNPVLEGEEQRIEFDRMLAQLTDELQPDGALEGMMVEEIAACYWRLRRVVRYENREAWRAEQYRRSSYRFDPLTEALADALASDAVRQRKREARMIAKSGLAGMSLPDDDVSESVLRYETAIKRQLFRAMERLEHLQRRRKLESARQKAEDGPDCVEIVFAEQTQRGGARPAPRPRATAKKPGWLARWLGRLASVNPLARSSVAWRRAGRGAKRPA